MKEVVAPYNIIPDTIEQAIVWRPDYNGLREGILKHFNSTSKHYLICGCLLCEARREKVWDKDGCGANTFGEWVERVCNLRRSQVQRMISIWEALRPIIEKQSELILAIDFSKLALIAPYIMKLNEEEQVTMLHSAKELSVKALEANLKEMDGKPTQDNCDHEKTERFLRCCRCEKFIKEI